MEKFINSILDVYPLPEHDLQLLLQAGVETTYNKGSHIVKAGQVNRSLYILKSGIWRSYFTEGKREITTWFVISGEAAFSSWSYVQGKPSKLNIESVTKSTALHYDKETLESLFAASVHLGIWGRKLVERILLSTDQWLVDFSKPLATQRYGVLVEKTPEILLNVPLKDIAGFLNITPQSLSRIRAEWLKK